MLERIDEWLMNHPVLVDLMTILLPCGFFIMLGVLSA